MKLVVGLGNPGKKYHNSKHNIGFMSLNSYADANQIKFKKSIKFIAEIGKLNDTILVKPKTYMNLSGSSVRRIADYYNIEPHNMLVVFDDLNLPFAKLRLRLNGSAGGHNGIKSIINSIYSEDFKRLRIGIGNNQNVEMKDYVLSPFGKAELKELEQLQLDISNIIDGFINDVDFETLMNRYN